MNQNGKEHLEIERKWLVPGEVFIPAYLECKVYRIVQMYLLSDQRERLRIISDGFDTKWIHTIKRPADGGGNWEWERDLSPTEFFSLTSKIDSTCQVLTKERTVFWIDGVKYELDRFINPIQLQILEVELKSLDQPVIIPDWIGKVLEVTNIKGFSNKRIASKPDVTLRKVAGLYYEI
jgi:CYTH domain-containing protein